MEVLEAARRGTAGPRWWWPRRPRSTGPTRPCPSGRTWPPCRSARTRPASWPPSPYTLAYGYSFGLPTLAFRFFNVFGPLQAADHAYAAVVPVFLAAALRGEPLPVHGDGRQTRDFTYVGTVAAVLADAVLRAGDLPRPGQPGLRHPGLPARAHRPAGGAARAVPPPDPQRAPGRVTSGTPRPTTARLA